MFTVHGTLINNNTFDCINKSKFYRKEMCLKHNTNNINITATINNKSYELIKDMYIVIGETNNSFVTFTDINEAIKYKKLLNSLYTYQNKTDIFINIGKITDTDIEWLLI